MGFRNRDFKLGESYLVPTFRPDDAFCEAIAYVQVRPVPRRFGRLGIDGNQSGLFWPDFRHIEGPFGDGSAVAFERPFHAEI